MVEGMDEDMLRYCVKRSERGARNGRKGKRRNSVKSRHVKCVE